MEKENRRYPVVRVLKTITPRVNHVSNYTKAVRFNSPNNTQLYSSCDIP